MATRPWSDIIVLVNGTAYPSHRLILSESNFFLPQIDPESPFFAPNEIDLGNDVDPTGWSVARDFLYWSFDYNKDHYPTLWFAERYTNEEIALAVITLDQLGFVAAMDNLSRVVDLSDMSLDQLEYFSRFPELQEKFVNVALMGYPLRETLNKDRYPELAESILSRVSPLIDNLEPATILAHVQELLRSLWSQGRANVAKARELLYYFGSVDRDTQLAILRAIRNIKEYAPSQLTFLLHRFPTEVPLDWMTITPNYKYVIDWVIANPVTVSALRDIMGRSLNAISPERVLPIEAMGIVMTRPMTEKVDGLKKVVIDRLVDLGIPRLNQLAVTVAESIDDPNLRTQTLQHIESKPPKYFLVALDRRWEAYWRQEGRQERR